MCAKTAVWDSAELLRNKEDIAAYLDPALEEAFETTDPFNVRWVSSPACKVSAKSLRKPGTAVKACTHLSRHGKCGLRKRAYRCFNRSVFASVRYQPKRAVERA
jgi:hypothetical protein